MYKIVPRRFSSSWYYSVSVFILINPKVVDTSTLAGASCLTNMFLDYVEISDYGNKFLTVFRITQELQYLKQIN